MTWGTFRRLTSTVQPLHRDKEIRITKMRFGREVTVLAQKTLTNNDNTVHTIANSLSCVWRGTTDCNTILKDKTQHPQIIRLNKRCKTADCTSWVSSNIGERWRQATVDKPKNFLTIKSGHVKLGYEFFEVWVVRQHILPSFVDAIKHPIREIKSPILQTKHQFWGRANEIKENESGCWVMRSVKESRLWHILQMR